MKTKNLINKSFLTILFSVVLITACMAQSSKGVESLLPMQDINQSIRKISKQLMGIESTVNISISADINDYDACQKESVSQDGLKLKISWYNTKDETGTYMLKILKDMDGINKEMSSFKKENDFNTEEAKEEDYQGGKLWVISKQNTCVNELTGSTGKNEYFTHLKCFIFNGTAIIKIELKGMSKPEKLKEMLSKMLNEINKFDFSTLKSVISVE